MSGKTSQLFKYNKRRVAAIVRSVSRYNLTIRQFWCRFDGSDFVYKIVAARKHSGNRGGHLRCYRFWKLKNLYPEQRNAIELLPQE